VRTAGWAGSARAAGRRPARDGGAPKTARRIREAGAAGPPATGRRGGVLNITAAVWTVGFHWWRSGNKKRTQNVSEYMLVLALCLVQIVSTLLNLSTTQRSGGTLMQIVPSDFQKKSLTEFTKNMPFQAKNSVLSAEGQ